MKSERSPRFEPSPLRGVYRFRERIGGCPAWYAINCLGEFAELRVVRSGMDEKQVVAELVRLVYGERGPGPNLTLVHDVPASSSPQRTVIVHAARVPQRAAPAAPPAR